MLVNQDNHSGLCEDVPRAVSLLSQLILISPRAIVS